MYMKTIAGTSGEFEIKVGVQQVYGMSLVLCVLVMEEATRWERGGLWKFLYVDNLVTTAESKAEATNRFNNLRRKMEKTKLMVTGNPTRNKRVEGRYTM